MSLELAELGGLSVATRKISRCPPPRKSHRSAPLPKTGVSGQRLISRAHRSDDPERLKSGSQVFDRFESLGLLLFRKFILEPGVIDRAIYEEYSWLS